MNTDTGFKCAQCGSDLILINSVTNVIEGSLFPQTNSTYRCSNKECQEETDRQTEKRLKLRKDKEISDLRRTEERAQKRVVGKMR